MRSGLRGAVKLGLTLVCFHLACLPKDAAAAGPEVDVAIVFLVDMSDSMDHTERRILRDSHADAVASETVLKAIDDGEFGRVALAYVEFGTRPIVRVSWEIVDGKESAESFRASIRAAPMINLGFTGIGSALEAARVLFAYCPCRPTKRVVDVAADGKNNNTPSVYFTRRSLLDMGAAINGLPIEINPWDPDITAYFADNIIGGPAAFNLPVTGMGQLPERLRQKIVLDLY
ncbi:MAG: DUF1194 domain-containing protein, partial [Geminicoccaceae bacterium]